jgi:hypothetical protein
MFVNVLGGLFNLYPNWTSTAPNRPVAFTAARRGGCGLKTKEWSFAFVFEQSKEGVTGTVFSLAEPSQLKMNFRRNRSPLSQKFPGPRREQVTK